MDLKEFVGKDVCVQLRETWLVTFATEEGTADVMRVNKDKRDPNDPGTPVGFPYIQAKVMDTGALRMNTTAGGIVDLHLNPEVIHSVSVAIKAAEVKRIEAPQPGQVQLITP